MGNQQSSAQAITDIVNNATTNVLMQSSQKCGQNNTSSQTMEFSDITAGPGCNLDFSNISQTSIQSPNFTCALSAANSSELQNQLSTQLDQAAKSEQSGLAGALNSTSNSNSIATIKSNIMNNINISQVSECVQNNISTQKQKFGKISASCPGYCNTGCQSGFTCDMSLCRTNFNNISQSITQSAVGSCLSNNSALQKVINDSANQVSQISSASNKGIDFAASLASLGSGLIPSIICIILCCLIIFGSTFFSGGSGSVSHTTINIPSSE
jgi:hypothetical protein